MALEPDEVAVDEVTADPTLVREDGSPGHVTDGAQVPEGERQPVLVSGEVVPRRSAPKDGTARIASSGPMRGSFVYGDMMCPLLVAEDEKDKRTVVQEHVDAEGAPAGKTVLRRPEQLLQRPVQCPDCGIYLEPHQLVLDNATGIRSCAIALNYKAAGKTAELAALAPGAKVAAIDEAEPEPLLDGPPELTESKKAGTAFEKPVL